MTGKRLKALIKRAVEVKHLSLEAASAGQALTASEERFRGRQTAPDAIVLPMAGPSCHEQQRRRLFGYHR